MPTEICRMVMCSYLGYDSQPTGSRSTSVHNPIFRLATVGDRKSVHSSSDLLRTECECPSRGAEPLRVLLDGRELREKV
jgi:hypothetical protein